MCMKYVNANVFCFGSVGSNLAGRAVYKASLDKVRAAKKSSGKFVIDNFDIVAFLNIRGSSEKEHSQSPLDQKKKLDFMIRLTKVDEEASNRKSYNLRQFYVDFSKPLQLQHACFDYYERTEIIHVDKLVVDTTGKYVIKVLVKTDPNSDVYDVQVAHPIYIEP